jgi:hypothetical protein
METLDRVWRLSLEPSDKQGSGGKTAENDALTMRADTRQDGSSGSFGSRRRRRLGQGDEWIFASVGTGISSMSAKSRQRELWAESEKIGLLWRRAVAEVTADSFNDTKGTFQSMDHS